MRGGILLPTTNTQNIKLNNISYNSEYVTVKRGLANEIDSSYTGSKDYLNTIDIKRNSTINIDNCNLETSSFFISKSCHVKLKFIARCYKLSEYDNSPTLRFYVSKTGTSNYRSSNCFMYEEVNIGTSFGEYSYNGFLEAGTYKINIRPIYSTLGNVYIEDVHIIIEDFTIIETVEDEEYKFTTTAMIPNHITDNPGQYCGLKVSDWIPMCPEGLPTPYITPVEVNDDNKYRYDISKYST
jgi:hypothetical protein